MIVFPHRNLITKGMIAVPFLCDFAEFSSIALAITVNIPLHITKGELVATMIPAPKPSHDEQSQVLAIEKTMQNTRPSMTFNIRNHHFSGILDTGADVSVIRTEEWPSDWPTESSPAVRGVGGVQAAQISKDWLPVTSPDTASIAYIKPVILPLHINLWGRDLMYQFKARLTLQ